MGKEVGMGRIDSEYYEAYRRRRRDRIERRERKKRMGKGIIESLFKL